MPFQILSLLNCLNYNYIGGELLTLKGNQFGSDPVPTAFITNTLDGTTLKAKVISWYETEIAIRLPGLPHGTHTITINIPGRGTPRYR